MATSSVPAAKTGLLALLQGRAGLATLQAAGAITYGHPHKLLRREAVWMQAADFEDETVAGIRTVPHGKNEEYTIPVIVFVLNEGGSAEAAEERWYEIVGEIEEAVRNAPTLTAEAAGVYQAIVTGKAPHDGLSDGKPGWVHEGVVNVGVKARI